MMMVRVIAMVSMVAMITVVGVASLVSLNPLVSPGSVIAMVNMIDVIALGWRFDRSAGRALVAVMDTLAFHGRRWRRTAHHVAVSVVAALALQLRLGRKSLMQIGRAVMFTAVRTDLQLAAMVMMRPPTMVATLRGL